MQSHPWKTDPFPHQREIFERSKDMEAFALFLEMGTGKSKILIDTAAHLFFKREITGLFIVAPNGVHRNWITDELPRHMPDQTRWKGLAFYSSRADTQAQRRAIEGLLDHTSGLAVLAMTYDAVMTKRGRELARAFLGRFRCLAALDESTRIKNPEALRSKSLRAITPALAPYRRILTGTPVVNSPFDVYAQVRFLHEDWWLRHGLATYTTFQYEFGVWRKEAFSVEKGKTSDPNAKRAARVVAYKKLDVLNEMLGPISARVLKEDVLKDLPPKVYGRRYFEMTPAQGRVYRDLRDNYRAELGGGMEITAVLAMVRLTRLHQVTSGYIPPDDEGGMLLPIGDVNPRQDLLEETLEDIPHKAIVWSRFTPDITEICRRLGDKAVRYDGQTSDKERVKAVDAFRGTDATRFLVANPATIATGVTLTEAKTVVYYNNSFNLEHRLQSEDRPHRIGQDQAVNYLDFIAEGTVDERIVDKLIKKFNIAAEVTGDRFREWL